MARTDSPRPGPTLDARLVERTARELMSAGPKPGTGEALVLVEELHRAAETSTDLVLDVMDLPTDHADLVRSHVARGSVHVVDRLGWVRANAHMFSGIVRFPAGGSLPRRLALRAAARTGSVELGGGLAVLGSRILGQFDPFLASSHAGVGEEDARTGRLLLVAPNILDLERELEVRPRDFRLWVALHERTHQVQFAASPWLAGVLRGHISALLADPSRLVEPSEIGGDPRFAQLTTLMSLLEGHADVVMDAVPTSAIPTGATLRRLFDARRREPGSGIRKLLGTLVGIDEKLGQYSRGADFVRAVVAARGHAGLRPIWDDKRMMPTTAELAHPEAWLARVPAGRGRR
ncbi:zinc-dependent metalloprotease [Brevibacterium litoralis]|uniref:zinc-dependent metalloprotease n=1 Tax=Brevibacterium litoralis TaxID=3138935 RepID=UPI0032EC971D